MNAALIELVRYYKRASIGKSNNAQPAAHYAAYVLRRDGPPSWVELGGAPLIDRHINELRAALSNPSSTSALQTARALDEKVMQPIRKLLGETRRLFISPDGALNLVPFGALVDEQNRFLIEHYTVTYLTSGRDLLRLETHMQSGEAPTIIANPVFGSVAKDNPPASEQHGSMQRSINFLNVSFNPLPGTAGEAKAISMVIPGVKVLTEAQATEAAIKQVKTPRILHVATHGFFLPAQQPQRVEETRGIELITSSLSTVGRAENPLLRAGLALAGANQRQGGGGEDGVLTALEVAGLNLWGTKLVVLSACETGVGEVTDGAGVYGLRRALVLAGAESQVMSLWPVSDEATLDLMVEFYKRLQAGDGRTEALRRVQLEMLGSGEVRQSSESRGIQAEIKSNMKVAKRSHPFYWASFISIGDWRSLGGKEVAGK